MTDKHRLDYQKALEILDKAGEDYAREHPDWKLETFWDLVSGALTTLRRGLEDTEDPVSWEDPYLVAQYPAAWDWERNELRLDYLTETRLEGTKEELTRNLAEGFREYRGLLYLSDLTSRLGVYETGDKREPLLPPELSEAWDKATKEQREEFLRVAYRPFCVGMVPLELDRLPEDGELIGKALAQELAEAWKDVPSVTFEGKAGGKPFAGELVLMFDGLTVNEDERRAYFPITVGLAFYLDETVLEADEEPDFPKPSTWTEEERRALWDGLFGLVQAEVEKLAPEGGAREETGESGALVPVRSRAPVVFLDSPTRWSREGLDLARSFRRLRLPRKLPPRLEDLEAQEIARIRDEEGEDAFLDLRKITGDRGARGPLLKKGSRSTPGGLVDEVRLAPEAEEALLDRVGPTGFREVKPGADGRREEFLVKRWRGPGGPVSFGLSLYGGAGSLVTEVKEERRRELEERLQQGDLFEDPEARERVENELRALHAVEDAALVAEHLLDRFGQVGTDHFPISAGELKLLLRCGGERDAFRRVLGCLKALRNWDYRFRVGSTSGEGSFLSGFEYEERGPGRHGDGVFRLHVSPAAIGSLKVFSLAGARGPKGELLYSWTEKADRKELKEADYRRSPTSLLTVFASAQGFGHGERDLDRLLFEELTRNVDPPAPGREDVRARRGTRGAMEPRLYERDFRPYRGGPLCSLLPPGRRFVGALGRRGGEKGLPLKALLLSQGVETRGRANWQKRDKEVRELLDRMESVVEIARGGIVAVLYRYAWLPLKDARNLGARNLWENAPSFFFFLPEDWRGEQRRKIEALGATVTEDRRVSEAATGGAELGDLSRKLEQAEREGLEILPLHERLKAAREGRGLKQAEAAALFGVSQQALARWESRKPIRRGLIPLLERWIETGEAPTPAELRAAPGGRS